ncbi:hypothetical protein DACRYDRAFT_13784 [Dacryopinax primogenitus]|uniref:Uncharacterized protein n=1 Tax=Dacryopinax primogenitus (strain DJM 731) TaxID=1858805 RepID=M5G2T5_DACPD|nr:uncharacterized protein DACRYDRAFT_13784 [Dacryopinax primogenitus]EJU04536.1 hypothetical protein DACRYDRAFT_13784 [Dacryopinax primogenitus]
MLSMTALLRRIHRILAKEHPRHKRKSILPSTTDNDLPEITVIRQPFDFGPFQRAETVPASPPPAGWRRRLSARKSDAATARHARDKASQGHYVLRRSTVIFPDMSNEKWEAQLYAHANRSLNNLPVATVHFSAQVVDIPPMPKSPPREAHVSGETVPKRAHAMSIRPRRKPVPSLYALDPDVAPLLIPLPPSPSLSACMELDDSPLPQLDP